MMPGHVPCSYITFPGLRMLAVRLSLALLLLLLLRSDATLRDVQAALVRLQQGSAAAVQQMP